MDVRVTEQRHTARVIRKQKPIKPQLPPPKFSPEFPPSDGSLSHIGGHRQLLSWFKPSSLPLDRSNGQVLWSMQKGTGSKGCRGEAAPVVTNYNAGWQRCTH